ncbi:DUF3488 and transglutaminase-like domain-containing protein [Georgenia sp. MJ173]|uniref:transglutaminase family protein n=1 Tax=Georgenia sunbinii TaxID=3117728 RepID=UPI002F26B39E
MIARGRWVESLLAAVAVLVAGWPVGDLVANQPWVWPLVWIMLLVVVAGGLARGLGSPRWVVLVAQLVTALSVLAWTVQRGSGGSPDESAVMAALRLVEEGSRTIATYAVPAPATDGLVFIVLGAMVLLMLVVDAVAVTFAAPAMAGVPLLLMCSLTASSTGEPLHPRYFLAAAAAWLVLLARHGRTEVGQWSGQTTEVTTVDARAATAGATRRYGTLARALGVSALGVAVVVPSLLPHLPPTVLIDGLSRSGSDTTGTVSFTETLDLAQDLADRSRAPVIRYRTDDTSPGPLRVTVTSDYADGQWLPNDQGFAVPGSSEITTVSSMVQQTAGLEPRTVETTVIQNGLRAPQLAVPYPPSRLDLGEISWSWNVVDETVVVTTAPESYEVSHQEVGTVGTLPAEIGAPPERLLDQFQVASEESIDGLLYRWGPDSQLLEVVHPGGQRDEFMTDGSALVVEPDGSTRRSLRTDLGGVLAVDPASADVVGPLADELAGGLTNQIDIALALQSYLRGPDFSYSLTLADPVEGSDGEPLDAVSHFMATKQGYCTQFASAMVMMARSQDIPARLAVGFLPGDPGLDGTRTVVAADAHAWPELFITGLGWTRFEPTPGSRSGAAPVYQTPGGEIPVEPAPEVPEEADPTPGTVVPDSAAEQGRRDDAGWLAQHGPALRTGLLAVVGLAVLLAAAPLAARLDRLLRRRSGMPVEREWTALVRSLEDLGVTPRPELTPRGQAAYYDAELAPDTAARDALHRAVGRLESARYTAAGAPVGTMAEDARRVVAWRRGSLPRRSRVAAALFPLSGRRRLGLAAGRRSAGPGQPYWPRNQRWGATSSAAAAGPHEPGS